MIRHSSTSIGWSGFVRTMWRRIFWLYWYKLFPVRPPKGKGTRENPLELSDIEPLMRALRRLDTGRG